MKPDEKDTVVERLLDGLQPPQPPPELRLKAIAAARQRMGSETAPDRWSRVWSNRGLRLAWAASVVLLLAGHVLIGGGTGPVIDPDLVAEHRVDEYFVEFLRPAQISDNVRPIVGLFADGANLIDLELEGNPS
jgi:hypothetical protein